MPGLSPEVLPCPPEERPQALGILYRRVPASLRPQLVTDVLKERMIDLSGLWIARRRGHLVGAMLTQVLAGRAAAVWAPEVSVRLGRARVATALIHTALTAFRALGVRMAQALVDESSPRQNSADLIRGGLPRITELIYLERFTSSPLDQGSELPTFRWQSFSSLTEARFREVLEATYVGSLDMPELEGLRSLDDILASHREGGRFEADRWQVGHLEGEPAAAAILLLSVLPDRDAWEVAYLGLTQPARGRGLGRSVLAYALELAQPHTPRLELAVDIRNHPAQKLYQANGFTAFERRTVHLLALNGPGRVNAEVR
jgi:mycothiol synthase